MTINLYSQAPAKVILSGEHSVVYGAPALAAAVSCYAKTEIQTSGAPQLALNLLNFRHSVSATLSSLRRLRRNLLDNYKRLLVGQLRISDVLKKPSELFQYAFISLLDAFEVELLEGAWIKLDSKIPIGCGMGSSAASVVSFLKAVSSYLHLPVGADWLYRLAREVEHFQHGRSSGLDTHLSLYGGAVAFKDGSARSIRIPAEEILLVHTGKPHSTTGECVLEVKRKFSQSSIWSEFEAITNSLEALLNQFSFEDDRVQEMIRNNQILLEKIGVVPEKVQSFVRAIDGLGGVAKVCGAGAVRGNSSGIVAIFGVEPSAELLHHYGYTCFKISIDTQGARVIDGA